MIVITGANGNLGRRLLIELDKRKLPARAVVRSQRAAAAIGRLELDSPVEVRIVDYLDEVAMRDAVAGCQQIVHLVGIIRETASSRYVDAHERTCEVVARVAQDAGVRRIVYLSIVGTDVASSNACLASKAQAERLLLEGLVPALVLRVAMVLGEGDYASAALRGRARSRWNILLRAASLEQPIYAGDMIAAILAGLDSADADDVTIDLAGPQVLTRGDLTRAAAQTLGGRTHIVSLPLWLGLLAAGLLEQLSASPPVTRAMLGVLDHDDDIDPAPAVERLGISLTQLPAMLELCLDKA